MSTSDDEVLSANSAFYAAFRARDLDAMRGLWATEHFVACVHPGWHVLYGRDEVMASWEAILGSEESPPIRCQDATAIVLGDSAFVTCTENLDGTELVATNVFAQENGSWKLVHHHAGPFSRRISRSSSGDLN
jgi:ketosteroid isomerase-like protein